MAANDIANIAGTYGHHLSELIKRARDPMLLKTTNLVIRSDSGHHRVFQKYAEKLKIECDLCYIDPPYMKRQYAANYHILETLARGDEPEAVGASGLRPWRDQYSNFCTKTKIFGSFDQLFSGISAKHYLMSYSEDGLIPLDDLRRHFKQFGRVSTSTFEHKRFRSNNSTLKSHLREYLIHVAC
jgi:adenine-specific DNA-methyltransferase